MSKPSELDPTARLQRLQALEALESTRFKNEQVDEIPEMRIVETIWKGYPMLEFQRRNARPFSLSVKKLEAIHEGWRKVQAFLKKHKNTDID